MQTRFWIVAIVLAMVGAMIIGNHIRVIPRLYTHVQRYKPDGPPKDFDLNVDILRDATETPGAKDPTPTKAHDTEPTKTPSIEPIDATQTPTPVDTNDLVEVPTKHYVDIGGGKDGKYIFSGFT